MLHGNVGMVDGRTGKRMRPVHRLSPEITPDRLSHQPTQTRVKMSIAPCMRAALAEPELSRPQQPDAREVRALWFAPGYLLSVG